MPWLTDSGFAKKKTTFNLLLINYENKGVSIPQFLVPCHNYTQTESPFPEVHLRRSKGTGWVARDYSKYNRFLEQTFDLDFLAYLAYLKSSLQPWQSLTFDKLPRDLLTETTLNYFIAAKVYAMGFDFWSKESNCMHREHEKVSQILKTLRFMQESLEKLVKQHQV